ncbi:MAG: hypothetical protein COA73_09310 [Candidatus Hydrogenedentota bacterium]|nr:MAG: hypothetical protein COA73_09310 [Candidatus Hydrogenedentota bacterium]
MESIAIDSLPVEQTEPLLVELEAFLGSIRNDTPPVVSGEDGYKALKLAHDIMEFMRTHR